MSDFDLSVTPHARWLPLRFDLSADEMLAELQAMFPGAGTPAFEDRAAFVVGLAQRVARSVPEQEAEGIGVLAAWVLLGHPQRFEPVGGVAQLRAYPVPESATPEEINQGLLTLDQPRYGKPEIESLPTESGPAIAVRWRPVVQADGEEEVHEQQSVLWARPEHGLALVLSCYGTDLVEMGAVRQPLRELAAGLKLVLP